MTQPPSELGPDRGNASSAAGLAADITTIGFIGSGNIGSTLAKLAVGARYDVVVSDSRGPETLTELVDSLGPHALAAASAQAAAGEIVVVTALLSQLKPDAPSHHRAR